MLLTLLVYHVLKKNSPVLSVYPDCRRKNVVYAIRVGWVYVIICYTIQLCKAKVVAFLDDFHGSINPDY